MTTRCPQGGIPQDVQSRLAEIRRTAAALKRTNLGSFRRGAVGSRGRASRSARFWGTLPEQRWVHNIGAARRRLRLWRLRSATIGAISACMVTRVLALVFVLMLPGTAGAMFFEVRTLSGTDTPAAIGHGDIEPGDAVRLAIALKQVPRFGPIGVKVLALNSNGGSVQEAYRMAEVIDRAGNVMAVVNGAKLCASACTIVYLAAEYRVVVGEGALAFHSCRDAATGIANQLCNEEMADFAMQQGTFLGTVLHFTKNVPPNRLAYFDEEKADCWALTRWPGDQPEGHGECELDAIRRGLEEHQRHQQD